ncbi:hypothetical protein GGX14DRAFT_609539 [Mycena pura]|uniref:Zn(2)-C6 fungal-type domain-containing protein n=1 Tax=Mycena pura TaxID=153505 RepID=A0AAD6YE93_9AGAR|nr:hypothetical protein GGX14DRAFT_609539 [Mycena pura]
MSEEVGSNSTAARARPTTYVHKACSNCRHRKTRCDGERPICRRCRLRPPRTQSPCKYSHTVTPARGVNFPGEVELEDSDQVLLSSPYSESNTLIVQCWESPAWTTSPPPEASTDRSRVRHRCILTLSKVTPQDMRALWVNAFLNRFAQHHFFFLDPTELTSEILSDPPVAHSYRDILPSGLSNAVFLWACRVLKDSVADSGYSEENLLAQTISAVAGDTMLIDSWDRALRVMQAQVLLSFYYMETGRFLEGKSYCAAATSLAFSTGLHQLGYPSYARPFPPEFLRLSLPEVAENARSVASINAFRAVVILNNYWVAVSGVPSSNPAWMMVHSLSHHNSSMYNFPSQYHQIDLHSTAGSTNDDDSGTSALALFADASSLLARTIVFTALYQGIDPHPAEFWALDHRLESFCESLLPVGGAGSAPTVQLHLTTHIFVYAAILQLHSPHSATSLVSHLKCLSSTSGAARCLADAPLGVWEHADPVLGPLLSAFAEFLIAQLPLSIGSPVVLSAILSALHTLAPRSALIEKCHSLTQQRYAVAQMSMELGVPVLPQ